MAWRKSNTSAEVRNETYELWISSKDLLPYDAESYKRSIEGSEERTLAAISKRQKKSEWLGKSVEIAENALVFRDIDALWEVIEGVQAKKQPAREQIDDWVKNSRVILPGKGSNGFVVSTDEPYNYLQVGSRIDGKEVRLWVLENDLTEVQPTTDSESFSSHTGADHVSDYVLKGQLERDPSGKSTVEDLPEIPFVSTEELLRGRPTAAEPSRSGDSTDKRIRQFQKFRLGDYTYKINGCELRERLGSEYLSYTKPGSGAVFLLVRFTIANETKKTATVMSDDFTLRDAQGREFQPASKALTALMMEEENKDFLLTEVQPGIEKESITAFEVPKTALVGDLILIVPEKGFLGLKTVEVVIKPKAR